ncbi:hypothetical protein, partial [Alcanivorax jadensis]|uniref:hypothetical protein n=1 Tax=Alcanivorax jadensis TaxID=64988 RepID=UPI0023553077
RPRLQVRQGVQLQLLILNTPGTHGCSPINNGLPQRAQSALRKPLAWKACKRLSETSGVANSSLFFSVYSVTSVVKKQKVGYVTTLSVH